MSTGSLQSFEEVHYDQYDYYNLADYRAHSAGKGTSRKKSGRHRVVGHARRIAEKLFNSELKRKRAPALISIISGLSTSFPDPFHVSSAACAVQDEDKATVSFGTIPTVDTQIRN